MADREQWRKSNAKGKEALLNQQWVEQRMQNFETMVQNLLGGLVRLGGTLQGLEGGLNALGADAAKLDWRLTALIELLIEKSGITREELNDRIVKLQMEAFELSSAIDDKERGLEPAEGASEEGMFAIFSLDVYRNGELDAASRVVRSKVELGAQEVSPEVEFALTGLSVGESVSVNVDEDGKDVVFLTLHGLRKKLPTAPPRPEDKGPVLVAKEPSDGEAQ